MIGKPDLCLTGDNQISLEIMKPKIEIKDLVKVYRSVTAVAGIDLCVNEGSITGLLGPNGAGKTTTLRMLAGILKPTSGSIKICGLDIASDILEIKRRIGFLSGDTQLYDRLTVIETLQFFGRLHCLDNATINSRVDQLINDMDMSGFAHRQIRTLSSGQSQKTNIARAILHDPNVLILDEATVSLDIISSQFIIETLRELKSKGKAILFSTHIMSEAEYLCDQIAFIHKGKIVDRGTNQELIAKTESDNLTSAFLKTISGQ